MGRGRGVSCGGGQSSLGYLFGGGESANVNKTPAKRTQNPVRAAGEAPSQNETAALLLLQLRHRLISSR
ncbi:protein SPIRAL1-like 2 [Prunus yedoensis var. nudiflora]|uniref:Protein SPIRAL1-like 2 n=1 Tax=Prunus yedoensis var. nudiflora TaxID=2094558 RepID=A0A314XKH7_PRUYE|nr:protein SPIRAL1-like 2 [Prunus yedoensis var. nudiflora]